MTAQDLSRAAPEQASVPAATAAPRLRVAQVVTRMDIGGVPDHVMTLVRGFHRDFDVVVICASIDPSHAAELAALGVPVLIIPFSRLPSPANDVRVFAQLLRVIREYRFDVVHTHMSKAVLVGATAARITGVPCVVNTAHNLGFLALGNPLMRGLFWAYDRALFALTCDRVVMVSDQVRAAVVKAGIAPASKAVAIANGIDPRRFAVRPQDRAETRTALAGPDGPVILTVARLVWFKGLDGLLDAAPAVLARHPRTRIVIVGDGPLGPDLKAQAARLGIADQVVFAGERRDVPALLAAADVFVLPSVSEGMPISILEAMAAGKPVVATRVGGVADLVDEGRTGLLVPARDPAALADALLRLADDPGLRERIGEAGAARLDRLFSAKAMVARTAEVYRLRLAERAARR